MKAHVFIPKRIDDLKKVCIPFINQIVHVRSWHDDYNKPGKMVGNIYEFGLDIPEDELRFVGCSHSQDCDLCFMTGYEDYI